LYYFREVTNVQFAVRVLRQVNSTFAVNLIRTANFMRRENVTLYPQSVTYIFGHI